MKKSIFVLVSAGAIIFACYNSNAYPFTEESEIIKPGSEISMDVNAGSRKSHEDVNVVAAEFVSIDPGVSAFMKSLVQNYLAVKNALVNNEESKAAKASARIIELVKNFDKSLLTSDQKKVYDGIVDELKEQAEQISRNKIEEQRDHFSKLSKNVYGLVKAFGADIALHYDQCPMYNNGSTWLSETKEIRNPYYGSQMMTCGSVVEVVQ
ncbi:MAG: DUF3347 domain-containing protein [Ginsengibacter sp.]